ncbi:MAG: hypothetical protein WDN04_08955 [Rhodospirillales bacterium]
MWLGGELSSRLHAWSPSGGLWRGFWTTLLSAPVLTPAFVTHSKPLSLACVIASSISGAFCLAPIYAVRQDPIDRRARATLAAMFGVLNTLLGQAGGPLLVGAVSGLSRHRAGAESLRLSLEIVSLLCF